MNKVFVTGANGFIGRHLIASLLRKGCTVRAVVRSTSGLPAWPESIEVTVGDIRDFSRVTPGISGCDTVFHLAAKVESPSHGEDHEEEYLAVNVEGTVNVLRAAAEAGAGRLIYFSSVKAMGESTRGCVDESYPARPTTAYGRSKLQAEKLILEHGKQHDVHVVCLRLPLVYGPGNKGNLLKMLAAVDRGLFPPVSNKGPLRSMVHVGNVVDAALKAATDQAAKGQCYIVTDARAYSVRELHELFCRGLGIRVPRWQIPVAVLRSLGYVGDALGTLAGRTLPINSDVLAKLVEPACYSSAKITNELGFKPRLTLEQALPEIIRWYREGREQRTTDDEH